MSIFEKPTIFAKLNYIHIT